LHGDHVFGLSGLLASLGLAGACTDGIDLYGPDPLREYLEGVLRTSSTRIGYPLRIHRVHQAAASGAVLLDDGDITVRSAPLTHRVPAYAYRVIRSLCPAISTWPGPGHWEFHRGPSMPSSRRAAASPSPMAG
jgi:ribonuclease BN (tRNA processing enzyme)